MRISVRFLSILLLFSTSALLGGCDLLSPAVEPPTPSTLNADPDNQKVALSWEAPDIESVDGYNVYRSTSSFERVANAEIVKGGSRVQGTSFEDTGVSNGTTYHYRVTVVDTKGNESKGSNAVSATPFPSPPDFP